MRIRSLLVLLIGVALAVGAWLLHSLYLNKTVAIGMDDLVVETPLTVIVLLVILISICVILGWKLLSLVLFFPHHLKNWKTRRAEKRRSKLLGEGLQAMVLGLPHQQQKAFTAAGDAGVTPSATYYLAAAVSDDDKRQASLLRKAAKADGDPMIQAMATAQMRLKTNMPAEAAEVLRIAGAATHKAIQPMRLLLEANERSGDTQGALDVAQHLLERDPSPALRQRIGKLTSKLLEGAGSPDAVRGLLGSVSKSGNSPVSIAVAAATRLAAVNDEPGASAILLTALKQHPDPEVIAAIAKYGTDELIERSMKMSDELLRDNPGNTDYLCAFADLAMRAKLWGQARKLLEEAMAIKEERRTYIRLARLAEQEGKSADETSRLYQLAAQASD